MLKKTILALLIFVGLPSLLAAFTSDEPEVDLRFDHYYTYDQLSTALKQLADTYPDLARLESVGKSYQKRDIWVMTISNSKTGEEKHKPAIYLDGNIHGNEIQATEVLLYTMNYILKN